MKENKMKPKRTQKHPGHTWQAQVKPFAGKIFYLDLQSNRTVETLESDIKALGGTVEKFFSKEIKYLVSNKREARYVHRLRQDSPVPSPDSGQGSPQPQIPGKPPGQTDMLFKSRGKCLVERVVKEQGRVQMDRMLLNALEWGVKVLYIDDVIKYIDKKKKNFSTSNPSASTSVKAHEKKESSSKNAAHRCKGHRISKPFIKVEDSSRHYRPIHLTMPKMPELNLTTAAPCIPFCAEGKDTPETKQGPRVGKDSASEEKGRLWKKNRDKKRSGYCECCTVKYDNLKMHLQSERHKAFSRSKEYTVVDRLVSDLHFSFLPMEAHKRRKCSVSSVLIVPELHMETGPSHQADPSEMAKTTQEHPTDDSGGFYSGRSLKNISSSGPSSQTGSKFLQKKCFTSSDRSNHRFVSCRRTCQQTSWTPCPHKAEQLRVPQLKSEMQHPENELLHFCSSRDSQVNPPDRSHKDSNGSTSFLESPNLEKNMSSKSIFPYKHKDLSQNSSCVNKAEALPNSGNKLSKEEGLFSVRKIQRKIRIYKHKRLKVDTDMKRVDVSSESKISLQALRELFQSSDDMDKEFYGFPD